MFSITHEIVNMRLLVVVLAVLVDVNGREDTGVTCREKNGSPVDW